MQVLRTAAGVKCSLERYRNSENSLRRQVGLVPTMGALHEGHLSLFRQARGENDILVVSIFVNPLQFGAGEDLDRYPRPVHKDLNKCEEAAVDVVFMPTADLFYGSLQIASEALTQVTPPKSMLQVMCGRFRPGHFEGVATVVAKLLNLIRPNRAYFGQKDAQQIAVLRRVSADLNLPGQLVTCPIVREPGGLALSSRNQYLSPLGRTQATSLFRALAVAKACFNRGERQAMALISQVKAILATESGVQTQYVELVHPDTLTPLREITTTGLLAVAAYVEETRLIDNVLLRMRQPIIAIDGPAGAGKSTVARKLAKHLNLLYLDSGAMYRAVTWLVLEHGLKPNDEVAIAELIQDCDIQLASSGDDPAWAAYPSRIWVNGKEVTDAIRGAAVTSQVSVVAAQPAVRQRLLQQQQQYGLQGGVVVEGRDIGTQVFPDAELKIFLTASVSERARRRQRDLRAQNQPVANLEDLERAIDDRDLKDRTRRLAPLRKAADAIELQTDGLTIGDVVAKIATLFNQRVEGTVHKR